MQTKMCRPSDLFLYVLLPIVSNLIGRRFEDGRHTSTAIVDLGFENIFTF